MLKECKVCKEELEKEIYFTGRSARCKKCRNAVARAEYDTEKEKIRWLKKKENNHERIKMLNAKACIRYRENNIDKVRASGRNFYHRKKASGQLNIVYRKEDMVASVRKWQKNNPHKARASNLVRNALRSGKLIKVNFCQICGKKHEKLEAHHHDYDQPLTVVWCCRKCHCLLDRFRRKQEDIK